MATLRVGLWTWILSTKKLEIDGNWFFDFNAGKIQFLFDQSNNTGGNDVKIDGSVYEGKSSFKMFGLSFSSKLDWGCYMLKLPPRKLEPWFVL